MSKLTLFCPADGPLFDFSCELMHKLGGSVVSEQTDDSLYFEDDKLSYGDQENRGKSISFDLINEWKYHCKKNYSLKKEPLAKSLGIKGDGSTFVVDTTCGTGKDSLLLLSFGAKVLAFERNPVVAALFLDAVRRAEKNESLGPVLRDRFEFQFTNSMDAEVKEVPTAIYIDPMYPHKKKKALPRKEMVVFRQVVGDDSDSSGLLDWARKIGAKRIVVKRPVKAEYLAGRPTASYEGKSTRYDLYINN